MNKGRRKRKIQTQTCTVGKRKRKRGSGIEMEEEKKRSEIYTKLVFLNGGERTQGHRCVILNLRYFKFLGNQTCLKKNMKNMNSHVLPKN